MVPIPCDCAFIKCGSRFTLNRSWLNCNLDLLLTLNQLMLLVLVVAGKSSISKTRRGTVLATFPHGSVIFEESQQVPMH